MGLRSEQQCQQGGEGSEELRDLGKRSLLNDEDGSPTCQSTTGRGFVHSSVMTSPLGAVCRPLEQPDLVHPQEADE